ncbi:flagellar filament capping protein FliD [Butyrivibrio sp. INlla16]|uniref:flagellar filament capping protein FliD n=1 Tax=Butyrivibrio sp. INlla16 TaxID=1520807 RepID=UPI00087F98C6|nr:flagellar filament capping protein FliD [Butyrivibrio sp. INlla16]SDB10582.1 flagellar hook-associated protein 2 [Butyrivibrio sp. INlla16]
MAGISVNEAYNHFASTYVAKENANVDKHKKSELQSVYKSIARINRKSPLHVLKQDDNAQAEAVGIKEHARTLRSQLDAISGEEDAALSKKSAISSNPDKVAVEYVGKGQGTTSEFTIGVDHLATNQINAGHFLVPDEEVALPKGSYAFNVSINGHDYEFQYSIRDGNTNHDIQAKLSRLINKAGIGLIAGMQEDAQGRTTLIIGSSDTGLKPGHTHRFEVSESQISENPHSVSYFGLNLIAQEPTNAHFYLNGTEHSSSSNRFTVGNEFDITLRGATEPGNPITISIEDENDALVENVRSLINGYNGFIDSVSDVHDAGFKSTKLVGETIAIAEKHLLKMDDYGISLNEEGRIDYDSGLLREKSAKGPPKEVLHPLMDFAKALIQKTDEISIDPMKYVERPVFNYKDPHGSNTPSPYITSEYSGMMFNNYC